MAPQEIADEARRRSEEAVRRIREESRRRIEQGNGWRAFSSWCALATLGAGISLAALDARAGRLQAEEAAQQVAVEERVRLERLAAIEQMERRWRANEEGASGGARSKEVQQALLRAQRLELLEYPVSE